MFEFLQRQLSEKRVFHRTKHPASWSTLRRDAAEIDKTRPWKGNNDTRLLSVDPSSSVEGLKAAIEDVLGRSKSYTELPVNRQWASEEMEAIPFPLIGSSERSELLANAVSNQLQATTLLHAALKIVEEAEGYVMKADRTMLICSPIRNIPSELLSRIFVDVCYDTYFYDIVSPFKSPLLSVCRRWRSIVLETPSLWAQIQLDMRTDAHTMNAAYLDGLDVCLRRAKSTPLDISFQMMDPRLCSGDAGGQHARKAIEAITHSNRRLGSLDFSGEMEDLSALLTSSAGQYLQHLTVFIRGHNNSPTETLPVISLPKLQSLHLHTFQPLHFLHSIQAPVLSTLFLQEEFMQLKELGQISLRFPQITTLCMDGVVSGRATDPLDIRFCRLLKCDWLTDSMRPSYDMRLFESASQLNQLTIYYHNQLSFTTLIPLPSLRSLRILNKDHDFLATQPNSPGVAGVISLLRCCPDVTEIGLFTVHATLGDAILQLLLLPGRRDIPPACPALKHLILNASPVSLSPLKRFMMQRNGISVLAVGQKLHRFYDTWAPSCLLSTWGFWDYRCEIYLQDMSRATFSEVDIVMDKLPPKAFGCKSSDASSEDGSKEICVDCAMVFELCECAPN